MCLKYFILFQGFFYVFLALSGETPSNIDQMIKSDKEKEETPDLGAIAEYFKENRAKYKRDYQRTGFLELFYSFL